MIRLKLHGVDGVYHCYSRVVGRERLLDARCREVLGRQVRQVGQFCGVEVLAWCVLSNHFHVLLRVPGTDPREVCDAELLRRYRVLYPEPTRWQVARVEALGQLLGGGGEKAERVRARLSARMHDLSHYMKTLKQRYSVWYNRTHGRAGTLWSERYGSTLVQGRVHALQIVSAYIDLNAVRAGVVDDPKDYRWSGYGEAVGGVRASRMAIMGVMGGSGSWAVAQREYRKYLYCAGVAPGRGGAAAALKRDDWIRVMSRGGRLAVAEALRCRVRYFTCGAVLGSREWVEQVYRQYRDRFGPRRRSGARAMKGSEWEGLTVLRDLQKDLFG